MHIKELFKDIPHLNFFGLRSVDIRGISINSKQIQHGDLFIAKRGVATDGNRFAAEAILLGALAILSHEYDPTLSDGVTQIVCSDISAIEGELIARFYGDPSKKIDAIGVTGTNGKTTCAYLLGHLIDKLEGPCGLIGTVEWIVGKKRIPATHTTPDIITLNKLLLEMVNENLTAVAMEVSSHALDQGRVGGISFDAAIFTNLTQDHLDYHCTMDRYADAKGKLFSSLNQNSFAWLNGDDPFAEKIFCNSSAKKRLYGIENFKADLNATESQFDMMGTKFSLTYKNKTTHIETQLIGRYNISNCLACIGVMLDRGHDLEKIAQALKSFAGPPGRLESVPNNRGIAIFIDYAHTEDALKNVIQTLNEIKKGKLITLFGCGGDRDKGKRGKMGAVVEALSDEVVVTSDNPRSEDPQEIINAILKGCTHPSRFHVEVNRADAIRFALKLAKPNDIVLIAGKGHERYQEIKSKKIPFDDRDVIDLAWNRAGQ